MNEAEALVQSAAPLETAARLLRNGDPIPRHIITALLAEDYDIAGLVRSIQAVPKTPSV